MQHSVPQSRIILGAILMAGALGITPASAQGNERLGNEGIWLAVDTVIEFEFIESNGSYQSIFGIINLETGQHFPIYQEVQPSDFPQPIAVPSDGEDDTGLHNSDDFQGTPGNTVIEHLKEFTAVANTHYTFYLESYYNGQHAGTLYSTDVINQNGQPFARFDPCYGDYQSSEHCIENAVTPGGLILRWEDSGSLLVGASNSDNDYDDFIVRIGSYLVWNRPGDGCFESPRNRIGAICDPAPLPITVPNN
ncbi:MAG: hypothetical protein F6K09_10855 [Merismopedia sp. SIO2A8]|nr:hypothetical protein [Merismopedia sp. SIO2A8]